MTEFHSDGGAPLDERVPSPLLTVGDDRQPSSVTGHNHDCARVDRWDLTVLNHACAGIGDRIVPWYIGADLSPSTAYLIAIDTKKKGVFRRSSCGTLETSAQRSPVPICHRYGMRPRVRS